MLDLTLYTPLFVTNSMLVSVALSNEMMGRKSMFDLQQFVGECHSALDDPKPAQRVEALVKEAILAVAADPNASNLPVQYDSNYEQRGPYLSLGQRPLPHLFGPSSLDDPLGYNILFEHIIAEGDMVAVLVYWSEADRDEVDSGFAAVYMQIAIYEISDAKIVRGFLAPMITQYGIEPMRSP